MTTKQTCGECGTELPANAPQGLCPRCLAGMGLGLLPTEVLPKSDSVIERTGTMIGRYKLLEKIGEGGFGVVYMAEQIEPVQRKVALKIIKAGMDTREVIARFEAERQAIALMDHPNIARALDAGATEAGRPFFVMELVRGIPITEYCDQAKLPTRERLQLFMKVCQAVQHAHQKGVIHRDLKPSNVLVTEHDGEPVPKVIDFGVAKALGQKLTAKTLFTAFNHMIGTPAYMSPEQAALSGMDIDTRADIYSLGVLLYELLTGVTPFDADTFRKEAMDEVRRMIRETEPLKPSTRLQTLGAKLTEVAKHRGTEPVGLSRLVRGDLDWIVMKCLEKDRQRRYETANGLAADVARHLNSEPVLARSPSNLYRFEKMFRRHKLAFAAAGTVIASLIIFLGVSTWLFFKEKEARQEAVAAGIKAKGETARAEAEKVIAKREAARAEAEQAIAKCETDRADQALVQVQIQTAGQFFTAFDYSSAVAYLARVLRQNPTNEAVAAQVFSNLTQHTFIVPFIAPLKHQGEVRYAHFSPDGKRIVTASSDGTAQVWDARTGQPLTPPLKHDREVTHAQFSSDGLRIVTASADKTARVWDAISGRPLTASLRHPSFVGYVCFSPNGEHIIAVSDAQAWIWQISSGRALAQAIPSQCTIRKLWQPFGTDPFNVDGERLVTSTANGAYIWDVKTGAQLIGPLEGGTLSAEFSPDGLRVVTSGETARVWDAQTGKLICELKHDLHLWLARFSRDGQRVLTISPDRTAQVWNANTGRAISGQLRNGWSKTGQFSPDGRWVLSAGFGEARVWDAETGQLLTQPLKHSGLCWGELSLDGEGLVTASTDGNARVWGIRWKQQWPQALRVSSPAPEWVPRLLEAVAEERLDEDGVSQKVAPDPELSAIRKQLSESARTDVWTRWGRWLCFGTQPLTNLLLNGSFEQPSHVGSGVVFSGDERFSLPGWTCPVSSNKFFLEYGQPQGRRMNMDGYQAVCMNGDGLPLSLSQSFATETGKSYLLTFGVSIELTDSQSRSQLTMSVAGVSRIIEPFFDKRYVVNTWQFTAVSNLTTLTFTDSSRIVPSAHKTFLDAISVIATRETEVANGDGSGSKDASK